MIHARARRIRQALGGLLIALAGTSLVPSEWEGKAEEALPIVSLVAGALWYLLDRDGDGTPDFVERRRTRRDARTGQ